MAYDDLDKKATGKQAATEKPTTKKMLVANGRSVQVDNGFDMKPITREVQGKAVETSVRVPNGKRRTAGPGEEVELPIDEAHRLHALGFLRHPDEPDTRPLAISGATSVTEDGPVNIQGRT